MKAKSQNKKKTAEQSRKPFKAEPVSHPKAREEPDRKKLKSKKNTSLRLDKATLKALKFKAIERETSVQKLIESLIREYLEKEP